MVAYLSLPSRQAPGFADKKLPSRQAEVLFYCWQPIRHMRIVGIFSYLCGNTATRARSQHGRAQRPGRICGDSGVVVSIVAFQAVDPGSIPGCRTLLPVSRRDSNCGHGEALRRASHAYDSVV